MPVIAPQATQIPQLILTELAVREMRLLTLVVAVRKGLVSLRPVKGELTEVVRAALRKLVAAKRVIETDGLYSLA